MLWIICEWPSCRQGLDDVDGDVGDDNIDDVYGYDDDVDDVDDNMYDVDGYDDNIGDVDGDSGLVAKVD